MRLNAIFVMLWIWYTPNNNFEEFTTLSNIVLSRTSVLKLKIRARVYGNLFTKFAKNNGIF